jgi:hypothetical protein
MTKKLLFVTTLLLAVTLVAFAADVTGKWTYSQPGMNGGPDRQTTITLKQDGDKLTGSIPAMMGGRGGGGGGAPADPPPTTEITNGKVSGSTVTFEVHRQGRNGETVTKYEGTVDGDTMKLKVTAPGRGGGDPVTTEFTAKKGTT